VLARIQLEPKRPPPTVATDSAIALERGDDLTIDDDRKRGWREVSEGHGGDRCFDMRQIPAELVVTSRIADEAHAKARA